VLQIYQDYIARQLWDTSQHIPEAYERSSDNVLDTVSAPAPSTPQDVSLLDAMLGALCLPHPSTAAEQAIALSLEPSCVKHLGSGIMLHFLLDVALAGDEFLELWVVVIEYGWCCGGYCEFSF